MFLFRAASIDFAQQDKRGQKCENRITTHHGNINIGLIGCRATGSGLVITPVSTERVKLAVVCNPVEETVKSLGAEFGVPHT